MKQIKIIKRDIKKETFEEETDKEFENRVNEELKRIQENQCFYDRENNIVEVTPFFLFCKA